MGRRGPPAKPTKLKLVENTYRSDRGATREAQPKSAIPALPDFLLEEGKVEWARIASELEPLGLLSNLDRAVLSLYCQAWARIRDMELKLQETGLVVTTKPRFDANRNQTGGGNIIENPYYRILCAERECMRKCMSELGLTPAARSRINTILEESFGTPQDDKNYA